MTTRRRLAILAAPAYFEECIMRVTIYQATISLILLAAGLGAQTTDPQPKPAAPEREPGLYATLGTSMGEIVVKLFELETPVTVQNFVELARGGDLWRR